MIAPEGVVDAYIHDTACRGKAAPCAECLRELADQVAALTAERDRARELAGALEAQLAAVRDRVVEGYHQARRWQEPMPAPEWVKHLAMLLDLPEVTCPCEHCQTAVARQAANFDYQREQARLAREEQLAETLAGDPEAGEPS